MKKIIPILLYHSVGKASSSRFEKWSIDSALFAEHMRYLKSEGHIFRTVSQVVESLDNESSTLSENTLVITFDDGFSDFYDNALPVLVDEAIPATLFIVADYVGSTSKWLAREGEFLRPMLTWQQVNEIGHQGGIECGSHTMTHPHLDELTMSKATDQIVRSKALLEDKLGLPVLSFAYPYGHFDTAVRDRVEAAGYSSACAVKNAFSSPEDDRFALARIVVPGGMTVEQLDGLLKSQNLPVAPFPELLITKAWRTTRRSLNWIQRPFVNKPS